VYTAACLEAIGGLYDKAFANGFNEALNMTIDET
jgi:hypothetical protein